MEKYFKLLKEWNSPDDVISFLKDFTFSIPIIVSIKKKHRPVFMDPEEMIEKKTGVCSNIAYFFVKTLNFMNPEYAAFAVCYTWGVRTSPDKLYKVAKLVGTYKVPIWHEHEKIFFLYFDDIDYSTLRRVGPFYSLEDLHKTLTILAKDSLRYVETPTEIKTGVIILDVRVANDPRIRKALDFFGVDDLECWYGKHEFKEIK